jgi:hypothetical protein
MDEHTRDYIDKSIQVVEARLDGIDKATIIKTIEIDRRLEEHNKLREEVLTDRSEFVKGETYKLHERNTNDWKEEVDEKLTKLMTKYENRMSIANWIAIVAVIITIANLIILVLHFYR